MGKFSIDSATLEDGHKSLDPVDLLANVSHEIRNPLNAIIGLANLLKTSPTPEEQAEYLDGLVQTSENLLELANNLMDYSKLGSGKLSFNIKPVDLKKMIPASLYGQKIMAGTKEIEFHLEFAPEIPKKVFMDSVKVSQILINLVSNAVKFTEKGSVTVKVTVISRSDTDIRLGFSVKDTGRGISEENLEKIFKAFEQGSKDTNFIYGGTGLGLTISKRLINLMGGRLQVESEREKGSEFSFCLPAGIDQEEELSETERKEISLDHLKILVVDDNKLNRLVACKNLEQWNIETCTARNGREALELLQQQEFSMVLMDLKMPVMDGHQTIKKIKELPDEKLRNLPVIALTGSLSEEDQEQLTNEGFSNYLVKPFLAEDLLNKITSCPYCTPA